MKATISQNGNKYDVVLEGRIDTTNAIQFEQNMKPLMDIDNGDITIDCTDLEYTSSQGLRTFLTLQKKIMAHNGQLVLTHMQAQVKEVFDITGFSNIIKII